MRQDKFFKLYVVISSMKWFCVITLGISAYYLWSYGTTFQDPMENISYKILKRKLPTSTFNHLTTIDNHLTVKQSICHLKTHAPQKMPPNPHEFHFVTPPCSPKRRGSPPSCDPDRAVPLYPPPALNRNTRLPSPSPSASSCNTLRTQDCFSNSADNGDISELESSCDGAGVRSSSNSPTKEVPSVVGTIFVQKNAGSSPMAPLRASSPAPSPRCRALLEKRRRRFVEHRKAQSFDSSSPARSGILCLKSDTSTTKASTPGRSDTSSVMSDTLSPVLRKDKADLRYKTIESNDLMAELSALRAWKQDVTKEHAAIVEALECSVLKHVAEAEDLKREVDEEAAKSAKNIEALKNQIGEQQKDIDKKKHEIKELEDIVIWSETTLAAKMDLLKENGKTKDDEIAKLKEELITSRSIAQSQSEELEDVKSWKRVAENDMEQQGKEIMILSEENQELKGKLAAYEDMLQSKTVECRTLTEKMAESLECLTEVRSQLESKENDVADMQEKLSDNVNKYERTITELMDKMAEDAESHSEKVGILEKELSVKLTEFKSTSRELLNYEGHLTEARNEISGLCSRLQDKEAEVADLQKQIMENNRKNERTIAAMTEDGAKNAELHSCMISKLQTEISTRDSVISLLQKKLNEMRSEVSSLEAIAYSAKNNLDESGMLLSACQVELQSEKDTARLLSQQLTASRETCDEKQAKIDDFESEIETLKSQIVDYEAVIESEVEKASLLSKELLKSKDDSASSEAKIVEQKTEIDTLKNDLVILHEKIESIMKKSSLLSQELADTNERYVASQTQVNELDNQISAYEKTIASKDQEISQLKRYLEMRDESILSLEHNMNVKNEKISELQTKISTANENLERLEIQLYECKEDFKNQLIAEQAPSLDAICDLRSALLKKDNEIKQYKEDMKSAFAEITKMESKVVSYQLLNDALTAERDELRQWKYDAAENMKAQDLHLNEVTSQSIALRRKCSELTGLLTERDADAKSWQNKLDIEVHALSKLEEEAIVKTKEIELLKEQVESKSIKINELIEINKLKEQEVSIQVEKIREWDEFQNMTKAKLISNDEELEALVSQNTQLSSRITELEKDLERQKTKVNFAKRAIEGLEKTLVAVEEQRQKLLRDKEKCAAPKNNS
ncbi:hypothetical protein HJC23_005998 [Cyclotella cryptica]|uniref:Uncharacterized protein n=1 Tax=Cyclotella cryptica TaxID=29204 RepID=A0ABD3NXV8_9STRA|eukprot:CCRYP_019467-RA/>CCRYP_019467-RA protein AED:0.01 eAED:0.01 QI:608/1/1/1/0.5/0.33/3/2328/1141